MAQLFWFLFLTVLLPAKLFFMDAYSIPSKSMSPTLNPGDQILIKKWGYGSYGAWGVTLIDIEPTTPINRGDVLVFRFPKNESVHYIMRVVGLPGDKISFSTDRLHVNDNKVAWDTLATSDVGIRTIKETLGNVSYKILLGPNSPRLVPGPWQVPEGNLFVLGDNRHNANDSRYWQFLPTRNVIGKLIRVY